MLGPVQVLVVGVPDGGAARLVTDSLLALPADGPVRCLDAFEVTVSDAGDIETDDEAPVPLSLPLFGRAAADAAPVVAADDAWHLGEVVAPGSRAVVALHEHRWALGLRDSLLAAGGSLRYEAWLDDDDRATLETLVGPE
jgi:hypothetical protein